MENKKQSQFSSINPAPSAPEGKGRIGYIVAWLVGVPAWILFVIYMIRDSN